MSFKFNRILLKISGEALAGEEEFGIDAETIFSIADEVSEAWKKEVQIAIVIGGGNIFRGIRGTGKGIDRVTGDYMGMLATVINALAFQDVLEKRGIPTRVATAIEMRAIAEPYIRRKAQRHLEKGRVVIFAAGTGNPFFTTDTAAALRGIEMGVDVLLKATNVDGVYSADPKIDSDAKLYTSLTYEEVIQNDLKVMDMTAITLCRENNLPIIVYNLKRQGSLVKIIKGEKVGTYIGEEVEDGG